MTGRPDRRAATATGYMKDFNMAKTTNARKSATARIDARIRRTHTGYVLVEDSRSGPYRTKVEAIHALGCRDGRFSTTTRIIYTLLDSGQDHSRIIDTLIGQGLEDMMPEVLDHFDNIRLADAEALASAWSSWLDAKTEVP